MTEAADNLGDKMITTDLKSVREKGSGILAKKPILSCGNYWIDYVSGNQEGLFPISTIIELAALKGAGKTTLCLETIAYNQMISGGDFRVLYMDYEKNLVRQQDLAMGIGVQMNSPNFFYRQPSTMEGGSQYIVECLREHTRKRWLGITQPLDLIVIDTLAAARPKDEVNNKIGGTKKPGYRGKLWAEFFRNAQAEMNNDGPAIIVINHLQQQLDIANSRAMMGPPKYDSPGSNALKLYAAQRYFLKQDEFRAVRQEVTDPFTYETTKQILEICCEMECEKSKIGAPYRKTSFFIKPGIGIDVPGVMLEAALRKEDGSVYVVNNAHFGVPTKAGGGKESCKNTVMGKIKFLDHLRKDHADLIQLGSNLNPLFEQQAQVWKQMRERVKELRESGEVLQEEGHEIDEEALDIKTDVEAEDDI